jgi:hypothetical protein
LDSESKHDETKKPTESVGPDEILNVAGPSAKGEVQRLTPIQRAGLRLALGVGLAIGLTTLIVILDWLLARPALPGFPAGTTPEQAANIIQNFKELNSVNLDRATRLFDLVVVKAFLPVFTAILGYIFGTRADGAG